MQAKLTSQNLRGNWGTLLLPLGSDDHIDYPVLNGELDYLITAGLDGIYSNGTAGEFYNQTEDEFDGICELLGRKCAAAGIRYQIGVSHPSPVTSLERLKRSLYLKPDAFQVILPDWVIMTKEEQIIFLQKMAAEAGGIPIVLYNPPHAKQVLTPEDYHSLKESVPTLIGIKVAGGNAEWYRKMREQATHLSVFVPGHKLATGLKESVAAGSYSNIACLSPKGAQAWWALMQTDLDKALEIQQRILNFFEECIIPYQHAGFSNPALDKFLAAVGGWFPIGTRLRWPYRWIPQDEVVAARAKAKMHIPELLVFND